MTASALKIPLIKVSNCQYMMPSIKDRETGKKCRQLHFIMYSKYVNNDGEARLTFWKNFKTWFPAFSPSGPSQIRSRRKLTHSYDCFSQKPVKLYLGQVPSELRNLEATKPLFLQQFRRYAELKAQKCLKRKLFLFHVLNVNRKLWKIVRCLTLPDFE